MSTAPNYRRAMGFGEPLLAVRVGDAEVTLHRQEAASLLGSPVPLGSLHLMVLGPGGRGGGMVGRPWGGTSIGGQRIVCGEAPAGAATAEAAVAGGGPLPVRLASGVWLVVAPRAGRLTVTFRNAQGRAVKRLRVRPWPAPPDRPAWPSEWAEAPGYVPPPPVEPGAGRGDAPWGELIRRYGLGEPLLTVPVRDQTAALYRQAHTGRLWHLVTGGGGSFGPLRDEFSWGSKGVADQQVVYGPLPPPAITAEAVTAEGERLAVHIADGAFVLVAPSVQDLEVTFRDARGRRVWRLRIGARGRPLAPDFLELVALYRLALRFLLRRLRQRWGGGSRAQGSHRTASTSRTLLKRQGAQGVVVPRRGRSRRGYSLSRKPGASA